MRVLLRTVCFAVGIVGMTSAAYSARHYFYAACNHETHGYIGFSGSRHSDASGAAKDCQEHLKTYPRHRCTVQPIVY